MRIFTWIPLAKPLPLMTFPERLIKKWRSISMNLVGIIGQRVFLLGARVVGETALGNSLLQLNKDYALGRRGTVLELPKDRVIFEHVKRHGAWELEESRFLASALQKNGNSGNEKSAILDIGANTGLVTLQCINLAKTDPEVFLFEPIPRHAAAIRRNLGSSTRIHVNEFALSSKSGRTEIFTQPTNQGNTSLFQSVIPTGAQVKTQIELVDTAEYFRRSEYLRNGFANYLIKCDTQGMDALILSRIPESIWRKTEAAVIEVWALPEVMDEDVTNLLAMLDHFAFFGWDSKSRNSLSLNEIGMFWLSKTSESRNLFLSKSI
jgi:FkbM family methyltransferase